MVMRERRWLIGWPTSVKAIEVKQTRSTSGENPRGGRTPTSGATAVGPIPAPPAPPPVCEKNKGGKKTPG